MTTIINEILDPDHRSASWLSSGGGSQAQSTVGDDSYHVITGSDGNQGARLGNAWVANPLDDPLAARTYSADVEWVSGTTDWKFAVFEFDANDSLLTSNTNIGTFTPSATRARYSATYTPVSPTVAYICFGIRTNTGGGTIRVRKSLQHLGTEPVDYFDGDSPNAEWTGTPHASTSVLTIPDTTRIFPVLTPGPRPITMLTPH